MSLISGVWRVAAVGLAALSLAACGDNQAGPQAGADRPPPEVGTVTVAPEPVAMTTELPGRVEASRVAEVRARAAGIIQSRDFREGSVVKADEVLFRIDPAPLEAALRSAEAALAKAKANHEQARLKAARYQPLLENNAVSKEDYELAIAVRDQAEADVAAAEAARDTARLNLGYATVTAPISGRIGRALVTEGALVGQGEATHLATVQQVDPIYVNLTQSSREVLRLRRALAEGELTGPGDEARVEILNEDGSRHPHPGKLLFSDITVDPSTGAVTVRALVPNPDHTLMPGMYVRARIEQGVDQDAIAVPQQAVLHNAQGASVMLVNEQGQAEPRPVTVRTAHEQSWIIDQGLRAGDRVIVDGLQKIRPGAPVTAVPWTNPLAGGGAQGPEQVSLAR